MMVLLYAVADAAPDTASSEGLENRPLRTVSSHGLRAIVSDLDAVPAPEPRMLWAYDGVVTRLMETATVLPARFGSAARDDREITMMLAARKADLTQALEHVRGAAEFAVHIELGSSEALADPEKPGTAYMRGLLAQSARLRELESLAGGLVRAQTRRSASSFAYLVDQEHADQFQDLAGVLGLTVTGPWPPYSFVGAPA